MRSFFRGRRARTASIATSSLLAFAVSSYALDWKTFTSDYGFTISYPAKGWYPREFIPAADHGLWIQTQKKNAIQDVVDKGNALIWVYRAAQGEGLSTWHVPTAGMYEPRVLKRAELSASSVAPGCDRAVEESWAWKMQTYEEIRQRRPASEPATETNFYCQRHNNIIRISISFTPGDKRQSEYEAVGLAMLKTLRLRN